MKHSTAITTPAVGFDYGAMELPERSAMQLSADRIRERLSSIHRDFLAIGAELMRVKERVPHGTFTAWVEAELGMTPRSAQNYMAAAALVQSMPEPARETVSLLPPTTLYKLAAPSTPKEVVAEVVQAAEAGALPPTTAIVQRIDEAAREAREVKAAQKAKPGRTEDDAKKIIAKRRAAQAAQRERMRQEETKAREERERVNADLKALARRLVTEHRDVMKEVSDALEGPSYWDFGRILRDALNEAAEVRA